jgi:hypothetical protein
MYSNRKSTLLLLKDPSNILHSLPDLSLHHHLRVLENLLIPMTRLLHERTLHLYRIKDHRLHRGLPRHRLMTTSQENLVPNMAYLHLSQEHESQHLPHPREPKCHHRLQLERFNLLNRLALTQSPRRLLSTRLLCRRRPRARHQALLHHYLPALLVLYHLPQQERAYHRHLHYLKPLHQRFQRLLVVHRHLHRRLPVV